MKKVNPYLQNGLQIFGAGLAAVTLGVLTEDADKILKVSEFGLGTSCAIQLGKLGAGFAPSYIQKWAENCLDAKNFDKNHDLESALNEAFIKTTAQIESELFDMLEIKDTALKTAYRQITFTPDKKSQYRETLKEFFFKHLLNYFNDPAHLESFIKKNEQFDISAYIESVFKVTGVKTRRNERLAEIAGNKELLVFFRLAFIKYFPQAFTQQLKHNDKAKTAYFKNLLELNTQRLADVLKNDRQNERTQKQVRKELEQLSGLSARTHLKLEEVISSQANLFGQVEQLLELAPSVEKIAADLDSIKSDLEQLNYWIPNLSLYQNKVARDKSNIMMYETDYIPFSGRSAELQFLYDFLDEDRPFSWCMLEGPGGIGKSKLAMKFCEIARLSQFESGFYDIENGDLPNDNRKIGGKLNLLIVIDDAVSHSERTQKLIKHLHRRVETLLQRDQPVEFKIRVLAIDRHFGKDWMLEVTEAINSCRPAGEFTPSMIVQQNEDLRWDIIRDVVAAELPHDSLKFNQISGQKPEILEKLNEIDPEKKPLFAIFAGYSLVNDPVGRIGHWNINNLLNVYITQQKKRASRFLDDKKDRYLLDELISYNTLARELTAAELSAFLKVIAPGNDYLLMNYDQIAEKYKAGNSITYKGLSPDILGGYFVLTTIDHLWEFFPEKAERLIAYAWINKPESAWRSFSLIFEDHFIVWNSEFQRLEDLLFGNLHNYTDDKSARFISQALYQITLSSGVHWDRSRQDRYIDRSRDLLQNTSTESPDFISILSDLLKSLYNRALRETQHQKIQPYYDEIKGYLLTEDEDQVMRPKYPNSISLYYALTHIQGQLCFATPQPIMKRTILEEALWVEKELTPNKWDDEVFAEHITFIYWNIDSTRYKPDSYLDKYYDSVAGLEFKDPEVEHYIRQARTKFYNTTDLLDITLTALARHPGNNVVFLHYMMQLSQIAKDLSDTETWQKYIANEIIVKNMGSADTADLGSSLRTIRRSIQYRNDHNRINLLSDLKSFRSEHSENTVVNIFYILALNDLIRSGNSQQIRELYLLSVKDLTAQYHKKEYLGVFLALSLWHAIYTHGAITDTPGTNPYLLALEHLRIMFPKSKLVNEYYDLSQDLLYSIGHNDRS